MKNKRVRVAWFPLWICFLCALILLGCDKKQKIKYPPLAKYFPATEQYLQGYSDVIMGDSLMRVPGEISKNVGRNGALSVFALWPEFLISQDKRKQMWKSSGIQRNFDTVHIYKSTKAWTK